MSADQQTPASVVERLRDRVSRDADHGDGFIGTLPVSLLAEAAAMIERLSAEREGLRDALEPIARRVVPDHYDDKTLIGWISAGEIRAARAALTQGESRQTEWVEWHGGGNPVGRDDVAEVKRRDGSVITKAAFKFDWGHGPIAHGSDIIAYRTPLPAAPTPADGGGE